MKTLKNDLLAGFIILLPLAFVFAYWNQFPDQIATHFDQHGKPNGYSSKTFGLLLLPAINLSIYAMFKVLPLIDPAKKNYVVFLDKIRIIQLAVHAFMSFIFFVIVLYALGVPLIIDKVIIYAVLTLFLILGNYMGNLRQNYFFGIKTPWTLSDEENWTKTHRLAAKLWVFATLFIMVALAFIDNVFLPFMLYVVVISIIPIAYSYWLYRKKEQHRQAQ